MNGRFGGTVSTNSEFSMECVVFEVMVAVVGKMGEA